MGKARGGQPRVLACAPSDAGVYMCVCDCGDCGDCGECECGWVLLWCVNVCMCVLHIEDRENHMLIKR